MTTQPVNKPDTEDGRKISEETVDALLDVQQLEKELQRCLDECPQDLIRVLKTAVIGIDEGLRKLYHAGADVNLIVFGRARLTDRLIRLIYHHLFRDVTQPLALIAVGGYGRGELHPKSDIDLMLLLDEEEDDTTKAALEKFLMLLWDIKLEIGHSVRTLRECIDEAGKDITVATNIMEARLLAGDEKLFDTMKEQTGPEHIWDSKSFFQAKLDEQIQRSGKFNDTAYNLEPNIKESQGGLRDIQMIAWVAKRHFNADSLADLVKEDFLLEDELATLLAGQHLLWRIRCSLHYLAGRREDRLLFDYQRDLALEFGFQDDPKHPRNEAIEQFMQQYYRTVIELERLNEMLLQHFREAIIYADVETEAELINDSFQVRNGYVETTSDTVFRDNPCAILEMFLILQDYPDIQGVRAATIRQVRQYRHLIDDKVRKSVRAQQLFIKIITRSRGVTQELRRMNRYGILAAYIPAFDSIVGRMQYDLFHAYTVDQHTLFVIRNMRRFSVPEFCHEFPLASGIFQHLKNPGLLYIAGLFHDIAKGRNGDHSELGAVDARAFCDQHGLPEEDADLVSWLVRNHLIMSMTAQRRDISDPSVISDFAEQVASLSRLDYLYLLTISDIRATNPKQWNNWKDKLLAELYNKTAAVLNTGLQQYTDRKSNIQEIQTDSLRKLARLGIDSHRVQAIWQTLNTDYFLSHSADEVVWHTRLINEARQSGTLDRPLVQTRIDHSGNSIELLVYMPDRDRIFYDVVTVLSNSEVDIVDAQITNATDGYALETFRLIPVASLEPAEINYAAEQIRDRLENRLLSDSSNGQPAISTGSKHKYFSSPTEITFRKDSDNKRSTRLVIETIDRTGVLANIAKAFVDNRVRILNARIATAGEKAVDSFTISTQQDCALSPAEQNQLKQQLEELL